METMTVPGVQLVSLAYALSLEVSTGMKATKSHSLMTVAKRLGYVGKSNKLDALLWTVGNLLDNGYELKPTIIKTLNNNGYEIYVDDNGDKFVDSY